MTTCPKDQLSNYAQMRDGASSVQSSYINIVQASSQTSDIYLAFGGNIPLLLQGHRPRHSPNWFHVVLTSGCFLLPLSLWSCHSASCPHPSVSNLLPFVHRLFAPLSGTQGLLGVWDHLSIGLRSVMPHSCITAPGRDHRCMICFPSPLLRPALCQTSHHLRLASFLSS